MEPTADRRILGQLRSKELLRKILHLGVGVFAPLLVEIGSLGTIGLAASLLLFNLFVFPLLGSQRLWRSAEAALGRSDGILFYPLALLAVALLFHQHLDVVAATWAVLAFGDGSATLAGRAFGGSALPWNSHKTWSGSLAYATCGGLAAGMVLVWTRWRQGEWPASESLSSVPPSALLFFLGVGFGVTLISAFLESQPQGLDDNLLVPPLTALLFWASLHIEPHLTSAKIGGFLPALAIGLGANLTLAWAAWRARSIDRSGAFAGVVLGTVIWTALGPEGFLLLGTFFVLGSGATRLGHRRKTRLQIAQAQGGRRSARNALANAGVAALAAFFAAATPLTELFTAAFAGALATAAGDTLSSELGPLGQATPRRITDFRPVAVGSDGGITIHGTLAGLLGSFFLVSVGAVLGLYPLGWIPALTLAGLGGNLMDSLLGATLESRRDLDNEGVNFLATLTGALLAGGWLVS